MRLAGVVGAGGLFAGLCGLATLAGSAWSVCCSHGELWDRGNVEFENEMV